jgi:hypothetical protein
MREGGKRSSGQSAGSGTKVDAGTPGPPPTELTEERPYLRRGPPSVPPPVTRGRA